MKKAYLTIIFLFTFIIGWSQTTDLSTSIEVTDLNGTSISNVVIFEEFYYVTTVSNSGNSVNNATFFQQLDPDVVAISYESINPLGGADLAINFTYDSNANTLTALLPSMPSSSSVEIRVRVRAPKFSGGIATTATVTPPDGTTDTTPNSNTSIVSMDVTYEPLDFSVTYTQVNPTSGTGISAWGDQVTFEFTITNNSDIQYPIDNFGLFQGLQSNSTNGNPTMQLISLDCIGSTNGVVCPTNLGAFPGVPSIIVPIQEVYTYNEEIIFPSQSSITFRAVFEYTEGDCGINPELIRIRSFAEIGLSETNTSSNQSNEEITDLLISEQCPCTDVSIVTEQIDPAPGPILADWDQQVTFQTTLENLGPLDTTIQFFLQNLGIPWDFISINCISATGGVDCSDINFQIDNQFWEVDNFVIPVGAVIVIETVVSYNEPVCETMDIIESLYRTTVNMLEHIDCDLANNNDFDSILLPQAAGTDDCISPDNVSITKTQVDPVLPLGSSESNPIPWGDVTYHITVTNNNNNAVPLTLVDFYGGTSTATGILQSVSCIEATGTAQCIPIINANIGDELTAEDEVFWEITEAENWILPSQGSVTFEVVVNWNPQCSSLVVPVTNSAAINVTGVENSTLEVSETSYLTSCVDLIIQTYPSVASMPINTNFNWIVDITNSIVSSTATDVLFTSTIDNAFIINGTPTCTITSGNASCITTFPINGNVVSGVIPFIDPDATIQIQIPVTAPNYGGSFNNIAEVQPDPANNSESDPSTNISISSVQVLSPTVTKSFVPDEILETQTSLLTFTVQNIPGNGAQSGIAFTDNLPTGVVLAGDPYWVESNGCTADFVGLTNDTFVGIANLVFPEGVENCTFAVLVTSDTSDLYTNEFDNFSNLNNIDASNAFATLNVLPIPPSADLEISLISDQTEYCEGDEATLTLTITNNGPDAVDNVAVSGFLNTLGFTYISDNVGGTYNATSGMWDVSGISISNTSGNNTFTAEISVSILTIDTSVTNQYETNAEITASSSPDLDSDVNSSFDVDDLNDTMADDDETINILTVFSIASDTNFTVDDVDVCLGMNTTLTINNPNPNYTYNWYTSADPDQLLATGTSYDIMNLTVTTSYEIETVNENNCPNPSRTTVTATAIECVDLAIEKEVDNTLPSIGETVTFTITLTNNGTTTSSNIIINELLPNGYAYNAHVASAGTYDNSSQLWTIASLDVGNTATLTLTVTVLDSDDYTNIVQITSLSQTDTNLANNSAEAVTFPDCLEIPKGVSPNNDSLNDFWEIECLENYSDNELIIFNRWGTVVYKMKNYANNWDGYSNQKTMFFEKNQRLPVGTYFYVLKLQGNTIEKTGWVYLNY